MRGSWLALLCALALAGCGGNSDTSSAPSSRAEATGATAAKAHQSPAAKGKAKGTQAEDSSTRGAAQNEGSPPQSAKLVRVPPISSAPVAGSTKPAPGVKTTKGADNSVQEYGVEASEGARTEAAIALQAYLNDRLQEDWEGVCSALAQKAREQLERFEESSEGLGLSGCAETMATLDKGAPQSQLREEATITEVLSFRGEGDVPGDPSYLIFEGPPGSTLYSMPMYLEGGAWKVGLALPSELPV